MTDERIEQFIAKIDHLEKRYKSDKYATSWLIGREILIELRDYLRERENRALFEL